ncbi:MAG: J domain-containing protein [Hyphomicrobiales bacterium]|jgi:curved DNA-binding protein CbpA
MTSDSPLFDSIRIKPRGKAKAAKPKAEAPPCGWEGCEKKGEHRAPKGRDQEGEFHWFCLEHVQAYNKSYNYFSGMNDEDLTKYQKASMTGHRPTWEWGKNGKAETVKKRRGPKPTASGKPRKPWADDAGADPFALFGDAGEAAAEKARRQTRTVGNAARKSFAALGLDTDADAEAVKARFKDLAKRLHPDLNKGDRRSEERLRDVIQAYNTLKAAGFC